MSTEGSWKAGRDGARAGIVMKARPRVGDNYYQEYAPGVAEDEGTVLSLEASVTVPYGTFDGVLKTKDFTGVGARHRRAEVLCQRCGLGAREAGPRRRERLVLVRGRPVMSNVWDRGKGPS